MPDLVRITVNLTPKSDAALGNLVERTQLNRTDLVNRALQLYDYVDAQLAGGNQVAVETSDGQFHRIKLI